jgi:catechol 2,3-dioxygenase-like lactoylglutathione lyase family enzyme
MRIGLTSIFVDDQDQAEQFYTQVLGFHVKTSAPYGPEERWLSVVSPEEPDGVELVLHLAAEPERLKAKGVMFVSEPGRMDYGGIDAVFADTCGNLLNLHQD